MDNCHMPLLCIPLLIGNGTLERMQSKCVGPNAISVTAPVLFWSTDAKIKMICYL